MRNRFIMLVGLPGAGKSTHVKEVVKGSPEEDFVLLSSDKIREEIFGDVNRQDKNLEVFQLMRRESERALKEGKSVIYDATNLVRKRRVELLKFLKSKAGNQISYEAFVICPPYEEVLRRNAARERKVSEEVILRMLLSFECPILEEGWTGIKVTGIFSSRTEAEYKEVCRKAIFRYMNYDQNTPYHTLSLGRHVKRAMEIYAHKNGSRLEELINITDPIMLALNFHDVGKPYARVTNEKGTHYYGHEHASSYIFLSNFYHMEEALLICRLIEAHMLAHNLTEKGAKRRFIEKDSYEWKALEIMAYCDSNAK